MLFKLRDSTIEKYPNVGRADLHKSDNWLVTSDQHHLVYGQAGQAVHHLQASWQADCKF